MVTVLAFVTISEDAPDALAAYFSVTDPLLKRAGARIIKRFTVNDVVVGSNPSQTVVIVEYPSRDAVDSVFKSPEYSAIKDVRDRAFRTYAVTIVDDYSPSPSAEQSNHQG